MLFPGQVTTAFKITPASVVTSDLYYPLSLQPAIFSFAKSDGSDIRVYDQSWHQVPRQVSGYDAVSKVGSLYVPTSGASSFYVTAGNHALTEPAPGSTYGSQKVWEVSAHGIWHMEDLLDSTANANNGMNHGAVGGQAGKILNSYSFTPSAYVDCGNDVSLDLTPPLTVFMWLYLGSPVPQDYTYALAKGDNSHFVSLGFQRNYSTLFAFNGSVQAYAHDASTLSAWHMVAFTNDGATTTMYVDNGPAWATAQSFTSGTGANLGFGARLDLMGSYFFGLLDEVRIYKRILSAGEIAGFYANQGSPASFWTSSSPFPSPILQA